jgi:hypothetical protein
MERPKKRCMILRRRIETSIREGTHHKQGVVVPPYKSLGKSYLDHKRNRAHLKRPRCRWKKLELWQNLRNSFTLELHQRRAGIFQRRDRLFPPS